jgi:hypothetical protein
MSIYYPQLTRKALYDTTQVPSFHTSNNTNSTCHNCILTHHSTSTKTAGTDQLLHTPTYSRYTNTTSIDVYNSKIH